MLVRLQFPWFLYCFTIWLGHDYTRSGKWSQQLLYQRKKTNRYHISPLKHKVIHILLKREVLLQLLPWTPYLLVTKADNCRMEGAHLHQAWNIYFGFFLNFFSSENMGKNSKLCLVSKSYLLDYFYNDYSSTKSITGTQKYG